MKIIDTYSLSVQENLKIANPNILNAVANSKELNCQ